VAALTIWWPEVNATLSAEARLSGPRDDPGYDAVLAAVALRLRGRGHHAVDIGAPGAVVEQQRMTDDNKAWRRYAGTYTVPAGQTITRFACCSISAAGEPDRGNLIDGVFFGTE
jgi:hypothetical protein